MIQVYPKHNNTVPHPLPRQFATFIFLSPLISITSRPENRSPSRPDATLESERCIPHPNPAPPLPSTPSLPPNSSPIALLEASRSSTGLRHKISRHKSEKHRVGAE